MFSTVRMGKLCVPRFTARVARGYGMGRALRAPVCRSRSSRLRYGRAVRAPLCHSRSSRLRYGRAMRAPLCHSRSSRLRYGRAVRALPPIFIPVRIIYSIIKSIVILSFISNNSIIISSCPQ